MTDLAHDILKGSRRALARALTVVENGREGVKDLMSTLYPHTGRAWVIGVTGAPGTGKSSLVSAVALAYRKAGKTVAIVAVDPTSPFTGGAILGDRIRMRDLSGDSGVFIRSMATRGSLGGLSRTTRDAVRVLDAAGFDIILIETVGAGQSEVDIARAAQTTLVVEAPGLGDDVQAIKAGILEIADILVVNKADRPGADNTVRALRAMLELGHPTNNGRMVNHHGEMIAASPVAHGQGFGDNVWMPPVIRTIATRDAQTENDGIAELLAHIEAHRAYLSDGERLRQREHDRIDIELRDRLAHALLEELLRVVSPDNFERVVNQVQARQLDPHGAVSAILSARQDMADR
jgi:LAO/AO transport system kinase